MNRNHAIADDEITYILHGVSGARRRFVSTHTILGIRRMIDVMIAPYLFLVDLGRLILSGNAGDALSVSFLN